MTGTSAAVPPAGAFGLLDEAIDYTLGAVRTVSPPLLPRPTPCSEWDLRTLLEHLNEALDVIAECINGGCINLDPGDDHGGDGQQDPAATFLVRAAALRQAWRRADPRQAITIADHSLTATVVATTLAVEIAVHGWDVSQASGRAQPIPPVLAIGLFAVCPLVIDNASRHRLFASAVDVSSQASPSDVLVAFLGRTPTHIRHS
jgi:uncharacterized protein (TIGR03086 family)